MVGGAAPGARAEAVGTLLLEEVGVVAQPRRDRRILGKAANVRRPVRSPGLPLRRGHRILFPSRNQHGAPGAAPH